MSYAAKVICDSIAFGVRLTTLEVTFPRYVLAEFNTHRVLSRNSASSRAIPVKRRIEMLREDPFVPRFGKNQKGMQPGEMLDEVEQTKARANWFYAMESAIQAASDMAANEVHKQWANRLLEPFSWHTVVVTATEWENFFALRCSPLAQDEIRIPAKMMREALAQSTPQELATGAWHLPYFHHNGGHPDDVDALREAKLDARYEVAVHVSVARCARVSYLTHDGRRDINADLDLYKTLVSNGHMSPLEHAAQVCVKLSREFIGNFRAPWVQHRKMIDGEAVFTGGAQ